MENEIKDSPPTVKKSLSLPAPKKTAPELNSMGRKMAFRPTGGWNMGIVAQLSQCPAHPVNKAHYSVVE